MHSEIIKEGCLMAFEALRDEDQIPTLRDQFAMAALPCVCEMYSGFQAAAVGAYAMADAMLEARKLREGAA